MRDIIGGHNLSVDPSAFAIYQGIGTSFRGNGLDRRFLNEFVSLFASFAHFGNLTLNRFGLAQDDQQRTDSSTRPQQTDYCESQGRPSNIPPRWFLWSSNEGQKLERGLALRVRLDGNLPP